jgi:hypothetical protein
MGVMLSLDRSGAARDRRRARHARRPGAQARAQALVVLRRDEGSVSGRLLSRLTQTVLPRRSRLQRDASAHPAAAASAESLRASGRAPAA